MFSYLALDRKMNPGACWRRAINKKGCKLNWVTPKTVKQWNPLPLCLRAIPSNKEMDWGAEVGAEVGGIGASGAAMNNHNTTDIRTHKILCEGFQKNNENTCILYMLYVYENKCSICSICYNRWTETSSVIWTMTSPSSKMIRLHNLHSWEIQPIPIPYIHYWRKTRR